MSHNVYYYENISYKTFDNDINPCSVLKVCVSICMHMRLTIYTIAI